MAIETSDTPAVSRALRAALGEFARATGAMLRLRGSAEGPGTSALAEAAVDGPEGLCVEVTGVPSGRAEEAQALARGAALLLSREGRSRRATDGLARDLLERYEELSLLYELGSELGAVLDRRALSELALRRALRATGAQRGLVAVATPAGQLVVLASVDAAPPGMEVPPGGVTGRTFSSGEQVLLHSEDGAEVCMALDERREGEPLLCLPLPAGEGGAEGRLALGAMALAGTAGDRRFTAGDAKLAAAITSSLASFLRTAELVESQREYERLARDLEIAADIQRMMLPQAPPAIPGVALAARCEAAANVGGDYYDHLVDAQGRLVVVIADVAGHSIGSALHMAMARAVLRREIADGRSPAQVLAALNAVLYDDLAGAELFITAYCARIDPVTGEVEAANAGHYPALVLRRDGTISKLDADGLPAGMLPDDPYEQTRDRLEAGETMLLYTDGVVEARGPGGELLGDEEFEALVDRVREEDPPRLIESILTRVDRHRAGTPASDDLTLIALERLRKPGG